MIETRVSRRRLEKVVPKKRRKNVPAAGFERRAPNLGKFQPLPHLNAASVREKKNW